MAYIADTKQYFEEKRKQIAEENESLRIKLNDITLRYRTTTDNIDCLKAKIKDRDCLRLLNEINKQTVTMHDLYGVALELMANSSRREFNILVDIIESIGKKKSNASIYLDILKISHSI